MHRDRTHSPTVSLFSSHKYAKVAVANWDEDQHLKKITYQRYPKATQQASLLALHIVASIDLT